MTRSSMNELFTPYKEPEREFRSSRRHFKTLSLDELRSPDFNLLSDQEYSEEEEAEAMAETMEQYMSKTRTDYGSGVARPKIDNKDQFELKGQFLKELRENTFSGSDNEDANEHIEKVLEIVDLFHVPNITVDQLMLRVFPISLTGAASRWLRNEPTGSIKTWEDLKTKFLNKYCPLGRTEVILFYNGLDILTRQILDSRGVIPTKTAEDAKKAIQEMAEYSQKWHNGTSRGRSTENSDGLVSIKSQLNNLGREIKKVNEKVYVAQVRATTPGYYQRNNANPSYQERRQSMEDTLSKFMSESAKRHEENSNLIKEIRATTDAAIRNQGASIKTLEIQIGQMSKVLQERGFGSLPSSTKTNPRDQVKSISTTIEADSHSIRRIGSSQYAVSTGQNSTLLYKSRQMTVPFPSHLDNHYCEEEEGNHGPKFTKAYGASHINNTIPRKEKDPVSFTLPCFINDVCFDNALVDLGASVSVMPLSTYLNLGLGELAHTRLTVELADRTERIMQKSQENGQSRTNTDTRKERIYKSRGSNSRKRNTRNIDAPPLRKVKVLENMDAYHDEGMGDVIFGEPFLKEVGIKTKRFEGIITIYNGDDEVTYQMVRSHPRFKHHTNKQCNKIPLLLKVSEKDEMNGISHAYQKLKGFYKGVLSLGPDYIRDEKTEECLTHGHISVHEMER
ncbi:retrovirus-related pol polyprotein from transposon TNT 1-94 [Tanacetum coccineum]